MRNDEIAEMFRTLANILDLKGENPFKLNAYRKVARVVGDLTEDIAVLVREDRLRKFPASARAPRRKSSSRRTPAGWTGSTRR